MVTILRLDDFHERQAQVVGLSVASTRLCSLTPDYTGSLSLYTFHMFMHEDLLGGFNAEWLWEISRTVHDTRDVSVYPLPTHRPQPHP